ncbi:hypothetical protein [Planktotalea sp.]|uniref:hypothetical protein n=1 Tax=Planktotalea sp. TaxID=2029877 RepID=UPI0025DBEDA7|nr:hypothetical protein [Planktotalea sp.]
MSKRAVLSAVITGGFCAVFAVLFTMLGMLISLVPGVFIAFVLGFLGSLCASYVMRASK